MWRDADQWRERADERSPVPAPSRGVNGRRPKAEKELREKEILIAYLPAQKSADEIRAIVRAVVAELPQGSRNQGAVMKVVMPQLKGQADGNLVRQVVTEELA